MVAVPENFRNSPRTLDTIMCFTPNPMREWLRSRSNEPGASTTAGAAGAVAVALGAALTAAEESAGAAVCAVALAVAVVVVAFGSSQAATPMEAANTKRAGTFREAILNMGSHVRPITHERNHGTASFGVAEAQHCGA